MATTNTTTDVLAQKLAIVGPKRVESDGLVVEERSADDVKKLLGLHAELSGRGGFRRLGRVQFRKPGAWDRG